MEVIIIIGFVILAISIAAFCLEEYDVAIILAMIGSWLASGAIMSCELDREASQHPTALDVYQGKTTLEITYKDGIPIDSVVVFKNKM